MKRVLMFPYYMLLGCAFMILAAGLGMYEAIFKS